MKKLFSILQKIGKSLMLPVSVLPAAGLLLRLGQPDLLNIAYMATAGDVIFSHLPMIFAVGVAIGIAGGDGVAALAAVVGELILEGVISVASTTSATALATKAATAANMSLPDFMNTAAYSEILRTSTINMGVFGGIIIGLLAGYLYNKFHNIKLPQVLGFFSGKRFIPIVTSCAALLFAIIGVSIWAPIQNGINVFAQWASSSILGPALYASGKRLLIPIGLHHMYYPSFLFQFGEYVSNGVSYFGDSARYFHGDPTAGVFMASEYPIIMFGLPGAALAMIAAAKKEKRKEVAGMMLSAAFVAFLTGITEPIEFSFIFVAPILFGFHVLAAFCSGLITSLLNIRLGYTFSASFIDYLLGFKFAGHPWLIWPIGFAFFALYFVVFYYTIKKLNLKTPGRDDDEDSFENLSLVNVDGKEKTEKILDAIGGKDNIEILDACITRLRLTLKDANLVNKSALKSLGAAGVMVVGNNVQVIFGTQAEGIKEDIKSIIAFNDIKKPIKEDTKDKVINQESNDKSISVSSPIDGKIVELSEVPDEVFADKLLGDGFAIIPSGNTVYAPFDGEIAALFPTNHAIALTTDSGFEILIHIGIDTVKLNGEGFESYVALGDTVKKGDRLISFDTKIINEKAKSAICPIVFTNMDLIKDINVNYGEIKHNDTVATVNCN